MGTMGAWEGGKKSAAREEKSPPAETTPIADSPSESAHTSPHCSLGVGGNAPPPPIPHSNAHPY